MRRLAGVGALLFVAGFMLWSWAGNLEPPGPPGPTMVTLQDISDKLDSLGPGFAAVPKTGQTGCWDPVGAPIPCAGTGQDGEIQAGVSVSPRFTDNGDGTVKDNQTGLIWLKDANCFGLENWTNALSMSNTLADGSCGLADGSVAGEWRLPNVRELHSLIDFGQSSPALPPGHPFSGVQLVDYWSAATYVASPNFGWNVNLNVGLVDAAGKTGFDLVWPVRGGQ